MRAGIQKFMEEIDVQVDEDHIVHSMLKGCFWDRFGDEDVADDAGATVKWVQTFFRHPMLQDIVSCEHGRSLLLLLEAIEALLETEGGTGSQGEKGVVKVLRL